MDQDRTGQPSGIQQFPGSAEAGSTLEADYLAFQVVAIVSGIIIDEWVWKCFGFKGRPRRGRFFNRFVGPEVLAEEAFLKQEVLAISLVEVDQELSRFLPVPMRVAVFSRILELLVDGDRVGENMWRALGFPSREAEIQFIQEQIPSYREGTPASRAALFVKRMTPIVRQRSRTIWIVGVARLFTSGESPIPQIHRPLDYFLRSRAVVGKVALRDHSYVDLAQEVLGLHGVFQ